MGSLVIPQEICSRIVQWTKQTDLPALCLISKAFLRAAECKLYEHLYIGDPAVSYRACQTIASRDRIALHVRTLWLYQDRRRSNSRGALSPQFWTIVHAALTKTLNLDVLGIADPTYSNSWVLKDARFQLREANVRFTWDAHLVEFLQSQNRLRTLQTMNAPLPPDGGDPTIIALQPGSLPSLQMYDGPLLVAAELMSSPITNLQVFLDQESLTHTYTLIPHLASASKTLRTLSMLDVPEEVSMGIFDLCSTFIPQLRHIGVFPLLISSVAIVITLSSTYVISRVGCVAG
jgi:hypothetical protein